MDSHEALGPNGRSPLGMPGGKAACGLGEAPLAARRSRRGLAPKRRRRPSQKRGLWPPVGRRTVKKRIKGKGKRDRRLKKTMATVTYLLDASPGQPDPSVEQPEAQASPVSQPAWNCSGADQPVSRTTRIWWPPVSQPARQNVVPSAKQPGVHAPPVSPTTRK